MKAAVLINQDSGASPTAEDRLAIEVREALAVQGVDADVVSTKGRAICSAAKAAIERGVDVIVAGGGDGTINAVASMLAGGHTPMGVLPLGTLNHFAKDVGIPLGVAGAAKVIAEGHVERLDVGRVNDRVFVNNSSLGVYARALVDRDARREQFGLGKWPAMALAVLKTFRRSPMLRVRLVIDGQPAVRKTPLVFVGNNEYQLDLLRIGQRTCLNQGELSLYITNTSTRWGLVKLALRAALGGLRQSQDFESHCVSEVCIETRRRRLHVAIDGEIARLTPPLIYRIWPVALPVVVPAPRASPENPAVATPAAGE